MGNYLSSTASQQDEMLKEIGLSSKDALYDTIPKKARLKGELSIPKGKSELGVIKELESLSAKNTVFQSVFRGAGAYAHYIPAIVKSVTAKEEFVTAYTPYQPEISQGILQSIFEYQTMICELTGMDVANASIYDGASAAAEAVSMCKERKRTKALISSAAHPDVIESIKTYAWASDSEIVIIPEQNGLTDLAFLADALDETVACVYMQQPNYYGCLEDVEKAASIAHEHGAKIITGINPIAAAIIKSPREYGADIAVGEGQPLGMPLSFGGPYLGFMATTKELMRKLPGRIVGETTDANGNRAFVLTLQAREQHIRREKASSNVCSNQAWCALTASVYLAAMGEKGLKDVASQCMAKAQYLAEQLALHTEFKPKYNNPFFHEFITEQPSHTETILKHLEDNGILGGFPTEKGVLWCATELNSKEEIDHMIRLIQEVAG